MRFLFISGTLSERNQNKSLWLLDEGRKAKASQKSAPIIGYSLKFSQGLGETKLLELAKQNSEILEAASKHLWWSGQRNQYRSSY